MRTNALGQAVVHRANLNVVIKYLKALLNISQTLLAPHHLNRWGVGIGHQQQLAVKQFQAKPLLLVNGVAEQIHLQFHLDHTCHMDIFDSTIETRLGARVRHRAALGFFDSIVAIELVAALLPHGRQFCNRFVTRCSTPCSNFRVMRHHQAVALQFGLAKQRLIDGMNLGQYLEVISEITIPSHITAICFDLHLELVQLLQVAHAEQSPVGHQYHTLEWLTRQQIANPLKSPS